MNIIRLPRTYTAKNIVPLLADSRLQTFAEARCYEYLWMRFAIARQQIKGDFLGMRIAANNLRAERYWRTKFLDSVHAPATPSLLAIGAELSVSRAGADREVRA